MFQKLRSVLTALGLVSSEQPAEQDGGVSFVLSDEVGWTEEEKAAAKSAGMAKWLELLANSGGEEAPDTITVTRADAAAKLEQQAATRAEEKERFRKQEITLNANDEEAAARVIENWRASWSGRDTEALRHDAQVKPLTEIGPESLSVLASIAAKHNLDSLSALDYFEPLAEPGDVPTYLPVEFYQFAGGGGPEVGLFVHDPDSNFKDWSIAYNDYTESDVRLGSIGESVVDYVGEIVDQRLEWIADEAEESEGYEPEAGEDLAKILPLLNEAFGFQFPVSGDVPFWATGEEIPTELGHTQPAPEKPEGVFYRTLDEAGVAVPEGTIDTEFLDTLEWPETYQHGLRSHTLSATFLSTAIERLEAGEAGTALAILRNYLTVLLNSRSRGSEEWLANLENATDLLIECYVRLERPTLGWRVVERNRKLLEDFGKR